MANKWMRKLGMGMSVIMSISQLCVGMVYAAEDGDGSDGEIFVDLLEEKFAEDESTDVKEEDIQETDVLPLYAAEGNTTWQDDFPFEMSTDENGKDIIVLRCGDLSLGYSGNETTLKIPAQAVIDGKTYGVWVGRRAFSCNQLLKSVSFEEGIVLDEDATELFWGCSNLENVDFRGVDASRLTNMRGMLGGCEALKTVDLPDDTGKVTDMGHLFDGSGIVEVDFSGFDTSAVTNMECMFADCQNLTVLTLTGMDTSNVTNMSNMFSGCNSLNELDLSGWDLAKLESNTQKDIGELSIFGGNAPAPDILHTPRNLSADIHIPLAKLYKDADGKEYTELPNGGDSTGSIVLNCVGYEAGSTSVSGTIKASELETGGKYVLTEDTVLIMDKDLEIASIKGKTANQEAICNLTIEGSGNLSIMECISDVRTLTASGEGSIKAGKELENGWNGSSIIGIEAQTLIVDGADIQFVNFPAMVYANKVIVKDGCLKLGGWGQDINTLEVTGGSVETEDGYIAFLSGLHKIHITGGLVNIYNLGAQDFLIEGGNVTSDFIECSEVQIRGGKLDIKAIRAEQLNISDGELNVNGGMNVGVGNASFLNVGIQAASMTVSGGNIKISLTDVNGRAILLNDNGKDLQNDKAVAGNLKFENRMGIFSPKGGSLKNEVVEGTVNGTQGYYHISYYVDKDGNVAYEMVIEEQPDPTSEFIKDAAAQIEEKGVDAVVESIRNEDTTSLVKAMADPKGVAALAVIEGSYIETHNITEEAPESTVEEIDATKVEMTGAALNTDSGSVGLVISEAENTEAVDQTKYEDVFLFEMTVEARKEDGSQVDYSEELAIPVTITLPVPASVSLEGLKVVHYNDDGNGTELKVLVDTQKRTVTFTVTHFSLFAFANNYNDPDILMNDDGTIIVVAKGIELKNYTGMADYNGGKFLVDKGKIATGVSGVQLDPVREDAFWFLANGQVQFDYEGLTVYDGEWFYLKDGKVALDVIGYVSYDGGLFYVSVGRILRESSGLAKDPNGTAWYYLAEGQAQTQYTGLAQYDGEWFYVIEGRLAEDYTGPVEYDGATFNVVNGMVR